MKKLITVLIISFAFLFGISDISASTIFNTSEEVTGNISLAITFEQGYVGGIHAIIQVNGDVTLDSVEWDSSLLNEYTKRYTYENNLLNIWIASGNSSNNLLDIDRNLTIGTFRFRNSSSENQAYTFALTQLTIVDAEYKSVEITDFNTTTNSYLLQGFVVDPQPPTSENPSDGDTTFDDNQVSNPSGVNYHPNTSDTSNENNEEMNSSDDSDDEKSEETNKGEIDQKPIIPNQAEMKEESQEVDNKIEKPNYFLIGLGVVGVLSLILIIIYSRKSSKH